MKQTKQPLTLAFELSNLCNLHCTHCIRGSHQQTIEHFDLALFRKILDQAADEFGQLAVVFTGGEPLASELFPPAVEELRLRRLPYRFVTNGWLIPRHVALLQRHPPTFVRVSLSGASESTHDRQRGCGSYRRALLGVATLLSRGLRAEMSMVVTRDSRHELEAAVALANTLGVAELHFILPQPTPESALDGSDLAPWEWDVVAGEVRALSARSPVLVGLDYGTSNPQPRAPCDTMAQRHFYVDARGRVPFCCQLSRYGNGSEMIVGDLATESLAIVFARATASYREHAHESARLHQIGKSDALDDYPCLSCARRHRQTRFLADFPEHPWAALAEQPA